MKLTTALAVLIGILTSQSIAQTNNVQSQSQVDTFFEADHKAVLRWTTDNSGVITIFEIREERLGKQPEWNPETGQAIPLSIEKACALARESLRKREPKLEKLLLTSISMEKTRYWSKRSGRLDRWYYVMEYRKYTEDSTTAPSFFRAVVLMDGTTVDPIVRNEKS